MTHAHDNSQRQQPDHKNSINCLPPTLPILATPTPAPAAPPAGVKRLFDLVKCPNEQLRVAFYYAMRDTVVAEDLEQASRIAYGQDRRWRRVVTVKVGGWVGGCG